ncbi:MAG: trigger factor [Phycisphaerales bacterium]
MSTAAAPVADVKVEDLGSCRKKLSFVVARSQIAEQLESQMAALMSEAALPGFRPGRVPRRLIEKQFGASVKRECLNQLVSSSYAKAVEDHKLQVLAEPEGNEELAKLELDPSKDLTFHLEVEVAPEFDLPSLDGIEVKKPIITVKDEQVTEQIERLRTNEGSLETQDKAAPGDYCIGRGTMKEAGAKESDKPLLDLEGAVVQIPPTDKDGKGAILGVMVDDFSKQAGLPKPGDTLTIKCKGPDVHERVDVRGKDLVIVFKIERVERIIPAKMEDIIARIGLNDEGQMREQVRSRLEQRGAVEQQAAMRQQVAKKLLEMVKVDMPKNVSARQAERSLARARMEMAYRGMDPAEIENRIAEHRSGTMEQAVAELKLFFIMMKAAQQFNVQVTEDEVNGRIYQIAMERRVRPDKLRAELIQTNQVGMVVQQVREHKAMDAVLARAKVSEMPLDEFNKLVNENKI